METKKLKPHQISAKEYLIKNSGGCLFMDMRLGKTLTAIEGIKAVMGFPALICVPYSLLYTWKKELVENGENPELITLVNGTKKQRLEKLKKPARWTVLSYEALRGLNVSDFKLWNTLVLDESIKIANPRAKITNHILERYMGVPYKIALCGLPTPENDLQAFNQMLFTNGDFMGFTNYYQFRSTYYTLDGFEWVPKPGTVEAIRDHIKERAFVLSRVDAGIGSEKIHVQRYVELNNEQKKEIQSVDELYDFGDFEAKNELGVMIAHAYIAGGLSCTSDHHVINNAKLKELEYLLHGEFKDDKVLVWCKYRAEQTAIFNQLLGNVKHNITLINGGVDVKDRHTLREAFNDSPLPQLAILIIASAAKGGDWSGADTSMYYSNDFSNDLRTQSEDRVIHPEKNKPVLLMDILTKGSLDEELHLSLTNKNFNSQLVMQDYKKRLGLK